MDNNEGNTTLTFEDFKNQNGLVYWWASDVMRMLGYSEMKSFNKVIDRVMKALISLSIPFRQNVIATNRNIDGIEIEDFKLTRFACYLAAMNGDTKKPEVARAQAYFAEHTRRFELYIQNNQDIDRLLIRDELADGNKTLASTAKGACVTDYAKFQNAGYLGMYNMESWKLEKRRNVAHGKLFDKMGRTELAANLFRVTQTEEYIKNKGVKGQAALEQTHYSVGRRVREIVKDNTDKNPENLQQEKGLPEIRKRLKAGYRKMKKLDKE